MLLWAQFSVLLERVLWGDHQPDLIQRCAFEHVPRNSQMARMGRIEGTEQATDIHGVLAIGAFVNELFKKADTR